MRSEAVMLESTLSLKELEELRRRNESRQRGKLKRLARAHAWRLAQRTYQRLIAQMEERIDAGSLDAAGIEAWEPDA